MKILHTGDWHVGRGLRGRSRAEEHEAVLAEIVQVARHRAVDLVLVAGDLFDSSAPSPQSEQIVFQALLDLSGTGTPVVLIAGNHDSPQRLAAVRPLLRLADVTTGAYLARPADGGAVDVQTRSGETARIALVPFQSHRTIVKADDLMGLDADQHQQLYHGRCRAVVARLTEGFGDDTVNLVLAHLTLVGGVSADSERQAHVFDYYVPAQIFPETAHYVAMGHLHRPQTIAGACPIRYCGSPLQLDFGEEGVEKCVLVVDAQPARPARVEAVPLRAGRRLRTLRGRLECVESMRDSVGDDFLRVVLDEPWRVGLGDRVREVFPNAVDVQLAHEGALEERVAGEDMASLSRSPRDLFTEYLDHEAIADPDLAALFGDLLDQALEEAGASPAA